MPTPEKTSVTKRAYNIGDVLPDGWIVGPVSADTGIVMSIEPVSGALDGYKTWHEGEEHAAELRAKGNANTRQPSCSEIKVLYNHVVKAGRNENARFSSRNENAQFNTSNSRPHGEYWLSTPVWGFPNIARSQYLVEGSRFWHFKSSTRARVRCVRDEPGLTLA